MTEAQVLAYVHATAALLELPLDPARAQRVAQHLARSAAMARQLDGCGLRPEDEPAEIYRPAPFAAPFMGLEPGAGRSPAP